VLNILPFLSLLALQTGLSCDSPKASEDTSETQEQPPPHRALVLLSLDTFRRDHVGRYGGGVDTPFLDALAEKSLSLDAHHACANWTYGAMICALGGADGVDMGWVPYGGGTSPRIPDEMVLLPEVLGNNGFRTGLVSTNGYVGQTSKMNRYYDLFEAADMASAADVVDVGLGMLDQLTFGDRWMLHLHFFDPHSPYWAPDDYLDGLSGLAPINYDLTEMSDVLRLDETWDGLDEATQALVIQHLEVRYRASIRFMDDELGRLYAELESRGLLEDALVVVMSDHGEQFFEYDELEHGNSLHGVEVDTFAFFNGHNVTPAAWTEPTTHADLSPTILAQLGIESDRLAPSEDLGGVGAVVGAASPSRPLFAAKREDGESMQSVDRDGKRLIFTWDGQRKLYDLTQDPDERQDIYDSDPDGEALWALLQPRVEALDAMIEDYSPVIP